MSHHFDLTWQVSNIHDSVVAWDDAKAEAMMRLAGFTEAQDDIYGTVFFDRARPDVLWVSLDDGNGNFYPLFSTDIAKQYDDSQPVPTPEPVAAKEETVVEIKPELVARTIAMTVALAVDGQIDVDVTTQDSATAVDYMVQAGIALRDGAPAIDDDGNLWQRVIGISPFRSHLASF